ncbi:DUF6042 family protein [Umezawaea sp. Da 62-37]|uniref:DUF6042 family protein n=1 Tax=Umezawaea sp. Da 62-37 TaxID=3075927 RepID=UPI0028F6E596|nr:DUF6042 family protein [Umezawaea sp. Da 62-37]WNV87699.1 DUF6042 family protein [Umezawaea sp. Da 62-37]
MVRLESHADAPPEDTDEWDDVVEIPYRSLSGEVGLSCVTGGFTGEAFPLGGAGSYRVRVTRRALPDADDLEDLWLLRFRPAEPEPPRWSRRGRPAVGRADSGWRGLFAYEVTDLLWAVAAAGEESGGATLEAVRQWGVRHHRTAEWREQPLSRRQPHQLDPADVARQFGVPAPSRLAGMLDLFAAAGLLLLDQDGYREPAVPPNVEDVLDLPTELAEQVVVQRETNRFCSFAADLVSVALWNGTTQTLTALAERTLVPEVDVRAALEWAQRCGLLRVEGSVDGRFVMTC